jgi:hypothetical protein
MAVARVVSFEGVTSERVAELGQRISSGDRPDDLPASEIVMLHDADAGKALVILFFEDEDDYARADATLSAMSPDETPGQRASVAKYAVAIRATP